MMGEAGSTWTMLEVWTSLSWRETRIQPSTFSIADLFDFFFLLIYVAGYDGYFSCVASFLFIVFLLVFVLPLTFSLLFPSRIRLGFSLFFLSFSSGQKKKRLECIRFEEGEMHERVQTEREREIVCCIFVQREWKGPIALQLTRSFVQNMRKEEWRFSDRDVREGN